MSVQWTPESDYVKELAKWEQRPTALVSAEMIMAQGRPLSPVHQEYPKAMYQAKRKDGGPGISGFIIAESEVQEASLLNRGWHPSQEAAIEAIHAEDRQLAQLAAERAYADKRMTAKAQIEAQRADEATPRHLPSVPETPIKTRRPYVRKTKETT